MKNSDVKLPIMHDHTKPDVRWREQHWEQAAYIVHLLRHAQLLIPIPHRVPAFSDLPPHIRYSELTGTLEEFELFLYQNEYEIAWNSLAVIATREKPSPGFWELLAEAAMVFRKYERYDTYFMGEVVRYHVSHSPELDQAIQSLPHRFASSVQTADAQKFVNLVAEIRQSSERG